MAWQTMTRKEMWDLHWYKELRTKEERRKIYNMARQAGMSRPAAQKVRDLSNKHASAQIINTLSLPEWQKVE